MNKYPKSTLLIAMGLIVPNAAFSQDAPAGESLYGLEEIVVTARKVGESIQDIPLSVTAFTSDMIRKQAITDIEDLVNFTPGVVMSNQTGSRNNPAMRFRSIDSSSVRSQQTSSAFLDGVYLPGSSQFVGMDDIERVEIVKGPQSAFFGRATFAGAVNYITQTPGNVFAADVSAIIGDNGRQDIWVSAEGPIIKDKLSIRGSARYYTYDGAWDNGPPAGGANPGREYGDIGAQETQAFSVSLYATPTENIAIKLRHQQNTDDDGVSTIFLVKGEQNNCGPFNGGTADYYCGTLSSSLISNGLSVDTSPIVDKTFKDDLGLDRQIDFTSLSMDWNIGGSGYTLSSVTGQYDSDVEDYRPGLEDEFDVYLTWKDSSFSQELRFSSPQDQRFRWMVGAYYLDLTYGEDAFTIFASPGRGIFSQGGTLPRGKNAFPFNPTPTNDVENRAIFGSVNFDITEQLTLSVELRKEEEDIANAQDLPREAMPLDSSTDALAISTARPFGGEPVAVSGSFKATLPRVILDYTISEDTMVYASYSKGNNPGGFNNEVFQLEPTVALPAFSAAEGATTTVEQAELISYEIGAKHSFANGRGNLNGAVYMMEWTNQRFRGFIANADSNGDGRFVLGSDRIGEQIDYDKNGSTDIWGFELSGSWALTQNWIVSGSYNYNKSEIQVYDDAVNKRVLGDGDASGFETARAPDHTAAASVNYVVPAGDLFGQQGGEWFARYDGYFQSETFNWTINLAKSEAAWLHNIRGGWRNDRFSVTAWIENLTDDDPVLASGRTTGSFATGRLGYLLSLPEPRTFGVTFQASFGG